MKLSKLTPLFIMLVLAYSVTAISYAAEPELFDFRKNPKTVKEFTQQGKWLVVMLWASDCHVCNKEAHQYSAFHDKHAQSDATVLGISLDGMSKLPEAQHFVKKHAVSFPNLIAEPVTVVNMYQELTGANWVGTPSFMVYNPNGELIGAQAGAIPVEIIEDFIRRESSAQKQS